MTKLKLLLIGLLTGIAGCAEAPPSAPEPSAQASPAELARRVIAERAGVDANQIEITMVTAIEFSDSSLGCPKPGMAYMQVITPGHQVIANFAGTEFDVRVSGARALICEQEERRGQPARRSY